MEPQRASISSHLSSQTWENDYCIILKRAICKLNKNRTLVATSQPPKHMWIRLKKKGLYISERSYEQMSCGVVVHFGTYQNHYLGRRHDDDVGFYSGREVLLMKLFLGICSRRCWPFPVLVFKLDERKHIQKCWVGRDGLFNPTGHAVRCQLPSPLVPIPSQITVTR